MLSPLVETNNFLPPYATQNDWATHEPSNSLSVPRVMIERPSSSVSLLPQLSSSQPSSEPLDSVLWDRRNLYLSHEETTQNTSESTSGSSSYALSVHSLSVSSPIFRSISPILHEDPPDYATTVQNPADSVQYEFSSTSYNSMIVVSSSGAQHLRPKYHIAITMNCFMPLSHITTIRRGGSDYGEFVAQFEMGIARSPSTVTINGTQVLITSVLSRRTGKRLAGLWFWTPPDKVKRVLWDCRTVPFVCRSVVDIGSGSEESLLASFTPAGHADAQQPSIAKLAVKPKGHHFFDDLLLSLLIIERRRLTPGKGKVVEQLFN